MVQEEKDFIIQMMSKVVKLPWTYEPDNTVTVDNVVAVTHE